MQVISLNKFSCIYPALNGGKIFGIISKNERKKAEKGSIDFFNVKKIINLRFLFDGIVRIHFYYTIFKFKAGIYYKT
jgi:hypothetical protein